MAMGETSEVVTADFSPNVKQQVANAATTATMQEAGLTLDKRASATVLLVGLRDGDYAPLLAGRLHAFGFTVEALCPDRHPLAYSNLVQRRHSSTWNIQAALLSILESRAPVLVIPCDDPARQLLTQVHARSVVTQRNEAARIIETSLGDPTHFQTVEEKSRLLAALDPARVRMPKRVPVANRADLEAAIEELSAPIVLKQDRTWGGQGVVLCRSLEDAERGLAHLQRKRSIRSALGRLFWQRETSALVEHFTQSAAVIEAEQYIEGEPANCVAACWKGEIIAALSVSVIEMNPRPIGPSTLVQIIDNPEISGTVAEIARQFGLSGVCGFDFVIERDTGAAHFLELNPRATPTSHVGRSAGTDVARALAKCCGLASEESGTTPQHDPLSPIALFPAEWARDPHSAHLSGATIPWADTPMMAGIMIDHAVRLCPSQGRITALIDRLAMRHLQRRLRTIGRDDANA
jgi:predicted ATP-grasp superfamily ATP-dependent carboligase